CSRGLTSTARPLRYSSRCISKSAVNERGPKRAPRLPRLLEGDDIVGHDIVAVVSPLLQQNAPLFDCGLMTIRASHTPLNVRKAEFPRFLGNVRAVAHPVREARPKRMDRDVRVDAVASAPQPALRQACTESSLED